MRPRGTLLVPRCVRCAVASLASASVAHRVPPGACAHALPAVCDARLCSPVRSGEIRRYMKLIALRANGTLMTGAAWQRKFVKAHPDYRADSIVPQSVAHDLMVAAHEIGVGKRECREVLGDVRVEPILPADAWDVKLESARRNAVLAPFARAAPSRCASEPSPPVHPSALHPPRRLAAGQQHAQRFDQGVHDPPGLPDAAQARDERLGASRRVRDHAARNLCNHRLTQTSSSLSRAETEQAGTRGTTVSRRSRLSFSLFTSFPRHPQDPVSRHQPMRRLLHFSRAHENKRHALSSSSRSARAPATMRAPVDACSANIATSTCASSLVQF